MRMNRMMYVNGDPVSFRDPSGNVCAGNVFSALAIFSTPWTGAWGLLAAAGLGNSGNYTGGGQRCYKGMPQEELSIIILSLPYLKDKPINEALISTYFIFNYTKSLSGSGPSPLGKLNRLELTMLLLSENEKNSSPLIYSLIYYGMTHNVGNPRSAVDKASFCHDQYGPNVFKPKNRRANSKWMGQAKTASFSHNTWSRNYKREWEATGRSCSDARDLCATVNTIGTTIADAAITVIGSVLFTTANFISGVETSIKKKRIRL
ncbi:MAG: hypothetical protein O9346_12890 [Leptospiraceae bacterium]|nr:hypothetical protein [Leptospiraceae bacterium]